MTAQDLDSLFSEETKIHAVWSILKDRKWHCRECEYRHTGITQIAGGAGIQGLERGTKSRPGIKIDSGNHLCVRCNKTTRHDRWTGHQHEAVTASTMPPSFAKRAVQLLGHRDVVDHTERPDNQLTVDHKLPMLRWTSAEAEAQSAYNDMTDDDIHSMFQLLKRSNGSISHNLLKSRSCEACYKTGRRGMPFGIGFFYAGGPRWKPNDKKDPAGCVGCGWYDLNEWRKCLNLALK